jgi:hypothetical protein
MENILLCTAKFLLDIPRPATIISATKSGFPAPFPDAAHRGNRMVRQTGRSATKNQKEDHMDQKQMFKQMFEFNKAAFDNTFNAMVMLQEQSERMANTMLEQATWLPQEGRKVITDWVDAYKKGRENFKKMVDESFHKVEEYFNK